MQPSLAYHDVNRTMHYTFFTVLVLLGAIAASPLPDPKSLVFGINIRSDDIKGVGNGAPNIISGVKNRRDEIKGVSNGGAPSIIGGVKNRRDEIKGVNDGASDFVSGVCN